MYSCWVKRVCMLSLLITVSAINSQEIAEEAEQTEKSLSDSDPLYEGTEVNEEVINEPTGGDSNGINYDVIEDGSESEEPEDENTLASADNAAAKTYGGDHQQQYQPEPQYYPPPQPQYYAPQPSYEPPPHYHKPKKEKKKVKKKKVFVPVFVPEKEKKKMKIISVEKGFYIQGGTQLFGKFKSLKHCMKACAITPACLAGDYNPWLHKCYQHTNYTACNTQFAHPQYVHFTKVPCSVVDAPTGRVTLGASMSNGIEQKGIDSLSQCIKKCAIAGGGIQVTATVPESFNRQACFAIDYDFSTHKCYFFGVNVIISLSPLPIAFYLHCPVAATQLPSSLGSFANPNVVHITFCSRAGFRSPAKRSTRRMSPLNLFCDLLV